MQRVFGRCSLGWVDGPIRDPQYDVESMVGGTDSTCIVRLRHMQRVSPASLLQGRWEKYPILVMLVFWGAILVRVDSFWNVLSSPILTEFWNRSFFRVLTQTTLH